TGVDTTRRIVEGYVPIPQLLTVAKIPQVVGLTPVFKPAMHSVGIATNQAEKALNVTGARTLYPNITGAGVKVGVLSDSANQYDDPNLPGVGLAESVGTGDLPNNVQVFQDGPPGSTDEGRAMLEQIHDIAPGASLAFNTALGGEIAFANGIRTLAQAGSQ